MAPLALAGLCLFLAAAAVCDAATARIPNGISGGLAAAGLATSTASGGMAGLADGLLGLAVGAALFLPWRLVGGVGSGDLKLMAGVGAMLGPRGTLAAFFFTAITGGVAGLALWLASGLGLAPLRRLFHGLVLTVAQREPRVVLTGTGAHDEPRLPYAVAIAFGTLLFVALRASGIGLPPPL